MKGRAGPALQMRREREKSKMLMGLVDLASVTEALIQKGRKGFLSRARS